MDIFSITSLVVSGITAIGVLIHQIHLKNCECFCIKSDCYKEENVSENAVETEV